MTKMNPLLAKIYADIMNLETSEQVRSVHQMLGIRLQELNNRMRYKFNVGDEVQFTGRRGLLVKGKIEKIASKNIKVRAYGTNVRWTVSPSLLQAA